MEEINQEFVETVQAAMKEVGIPLVSGVYFSYDKKIGKCTGACAIGIVTMQKNPELSMSMHNLLVKNELEMAILDKLYGKGFATGITDGLDNKEMDYMVDEDQFYINSNESYESGYKTGEYLRKRYQPVNITPDKI